MNRRMKKRNKTTYLLDECIPIHWPHSILMLTKKYELSINKVGRSASDDKVLNYAIKHKQTLITADARLTIEAILNNHPVIFQKNTGDRFLINADSEKLEKIKILDDVTKYLEEQNKIIIP